MDTAMLIEKSALVLLLFLISLGVAAYQTYFERKLAAWIQDRVGPDRAGPFGILQPIADGVKMFLKEDFSKNGNHSQNGLRQQFMIVQQQPLTWSPLPCTM